jgi:hypothetical protein
MLSTKFVAATVALGATILVGRRRRRAAAGSTVIESVTIDAPRLKAPR